MGQDWMIVNLDKRERTACLGELGQFFFHSPQWLMFFLAVQPAPTTDLRIGSWAGDRIICIGDCINDYPPGVLTDEELALIGDDTNPISSKPNLYYLAQSTYKPIELHTLIPEAFDVLFGSPTFEGVIATPWALRNLSKKVYVNSLLLNMYLWQMGVHRMGDHPLTTAPGLGQILMMNIAWSTGPSASDWKVPTRDLTRGAWAGDRVDVVMQADLKFEEEEEPEGWQNVTKAMVKEFYEAFEDDFRVRF